MQVTDSNNSLCHLILFLQQAQNKLMQPLFLAQYVCEKKSVQPLEYKHYVCAYTIFIKTMYLFKVNGYKFKGNNSSIFFFASLLSGSTLRGKNLLFRSKLIPLTVGLTVATLSREANRMSQLFPFVTVAENMEVPIILSFGLCFGISINSHLRAAEKVGVFHEYIYGIIFLYLHTFIPL